VARRDTARVTAALGLAFSLAPSMLRRSKRDQLFISTAASVLGAASGGVTELVVDRVAPYLGSTKRVRTLLVGAAVTSHMTRLTRSEVGVVAFAGSVARVGGVCALMGAVAPAREMHWLDDPRKIGGVALLAGVSFAGWKRIEQRSKPKQPRLKHYPGFVIDPASAIDAETLDFEGSRFIAGAQEGALRVFAGVRSAATVAERCRLAVDELERLGAFERKRILVCSPTLRGYVSPIPVAAAEHLAEGDLASVTVQYWDRRTLAMPLKVPIAAETHGELLSQLRDRLAARSGPRPEVWVYGESLGAWGSQNVFRRGGVDALDEHGVDRALWIGSPAFSRLPKLFAKGSIASDERVGHVDARELFESGPPEGAEKLRFVLLQRRTDPVVLFNGLELAWRRPEWLPERQWTPGITFLQMLADLFTATNWTSSLPQALAHDYRLEGPAAVCLAFGCVAEREALTLLGDRLVADELERAASLRALRKAG
jgi:uncharacterized membrane protein